jgi:CubicO group peptidase (beta-lactamase class C family)
MVRTATFPHVVGMRDRTMLRDMPWGLGMHLKHVLPAVDDCGKRATPGTFGHGGHFTVNTGWGDPGRDVAAAILSNGLAEPIAGMRAVCALSDAIHDAVDRATGSGARSEAQPSAVN